MYGYARIIYIEQLSLRNNQRTIDVAP